MSSHSTDSSEFFLLRPFTSSLSACHLTLFLSGWKNDTPFIIFCFSHAPFLAQICFLYKVKSSG